MSWFFKLLQAARLVSPELKAAIQAMVAELEEKAKATRGPVDDYIVGALKVVLSIFGLI